MSVLLTDLLWLQIYWLIFRLSNYIAAMAWAATPKAKLYHRKKHPWWHWGKSASSLPTKHKYTVVVFTLRTTTKETFTLLLYWRFLFSMSSSLGSPVPLPLNQDGTSPERHDQSYKAQLYGGLRNIHDDTGVRLTSSLRTRHDCMASLVCCRFTRRYWGNIMFLYMSLEYDSFQIHFPSPFIFLPSATDSQIVKCDPTFDIIQCLSASPQQSIVALGSKGYSTFVKRVVIVPLVWWIVTVTQTVITTAGQVLVPFTS